jgi:hypothetical protein
MPIPTSSITGVKPFRKFHSEVSKRTFAEFHIIDTIPISCEDIYSLRKEGIEFEQLFYRSVASVEILVDRENPALRMSRNTSTIASNRPRLLSNSNLLW